MIDIMCITFIIKKIVLLIIVAKVTFIQSIKIIESLRDHKTAFIIWFVCGSFIL